MRATVLLVCGDSRIRQSVRALLVSGGLETIDCFERTSAMARSPEAGVVVFAAASSEDSFKNLGAAVEIRRVHPNLPIVVVAGESSEEFAVAALRGRMDDLIRISQASESLVPSISRLMDLPSQLATDSVADPMIGISTSILQVKSRVAKIAVTDTTVLITGETGTGKELAAEMLHRASPRRAKPLIPVNCAAIPETLVESELFGHERGAFTGAHAPREGKFQQAQGGTVFLDEIGDMDFSSQAKLLRAIESKEVHSLGSRYGTPLNVRIVAATNQDPEQLVRESRFRKDLYFRLNVARIHLAPLRDRKEDIPLLVESSIRELNRRFGYQVEGCTPEAWIMLQRYDWPGNIRELKNLLEATFIGLRSTTIAASDFPEAFHRNVNAVDSGDTDERARLLSALSATNWNKSKAAEALQWSRMTIYRKMAKYHLSTQD
jgi:DNA-binding NtrC family response regulator